MTTFVKLPQLTKTNIFYVNENKGNDKSSDA